MMRRRSHNCGVEQTAADATCSPVAQRGGPTRGIAPGSISAVHTGVLKTSAVAMRSRVDVLRTFFRRTRHSSWDDYGTCKPLKSQRRRGDSKRRFERSKSLKIRRRRLSPGKCRNTHLAETAETAKKRRW